VNLAIPDEEQQPAKPVPQAYIKLPTPGIAPPYAIRPKRHRRAQRTIPPQRTNQEAPMSTSREPEHIPTVVIGGGQSGLSVGYHLKRQGIPFVILDANERVGDAWRQRWDSLKLFTPSQYNGLVGMPFPAKRHTFPTKDEMADFLAHYAKHFALPIRNGVTVDRLTRRGKSFLLSTNHGEIEADQVIVAMANYQKGTTPEFASNLDPHIVQMHSIDYRRPSQLRPGTTLLVGAGNSAAEIGVELAKAGVKTIISGRDTGQVPYALTSFWGRNIMGPIVIKLVFHRLLTTDTKLGRKARPNGRPHAAPLIRTRHKDLAAAGIERVGRTVGVKNGMPILEDGRVLEVANAIWCTGFEPGFSWIDLPVFGENGQPLHERGVSTKEPGLYFLGLGFLYAMSSSMIHGVARDAEFVARAVLSSRMSERSERVSGSTVLAPVRVTA
jgi:putative flavoprotein involved in K+ transport